MNTFKTKLQEIYDKYDMAYPITTLDIDCDKYRISMDITSYEDVSSNINWDIRKFIDDKIIGWGGVLNKSEYFTYSDVDYEVNESTLKQGLLEKRKFLSITILQISEDAEAGLIKRLVLL